MNRSRTVTDAVSVPRKQGSGISETEHNTFIRLDGVPRFLAFEGDTIGTATIRYEVPGLPAGTHSLYCSLHAGVMKGDLVVAESGG